MMEAWTDTRIFHSGDDFFRAISEDVSNAKKSICIESYIFTLDMLTRPLLKQLSEARNRGCTVKIIVDGFGSYPWIPHLDQICKKEGIELRVFHPLPYPLLAFRKFHFLSETRTLSLFRRINRRNHRKVVLIDDKIAYLGSMNFTSVHSSSFSGQLAWRDTGVRLEGPEVKKITLAFQITYLRTHYKGLLSWMSRWRWPQPNRSRSLFLNTTKRMRKNLYKDILRKIQHSHKRVYITTAYFLPKRSLLRVLLKAARRGVDVQLLIPGKSDVPLVKWAAFYIVQFLLQGRIPIFEYQKSILHAKTMVIDDEVYIGSFNLNHRSLFHDLEIIAGLHDEQSLKNMLSQWSIDIENSKPVSEKEFSHPSWLARFLYWVAFRLRYML